MAIFYLDLENGNDANNGTSFAQRWKTFNSGATAARTAPGDTIRIMASEDPTSLGIDVTFTNNSPTLTLASALTQLVTDCDSAWTASANVTCTAPTTTYLSPTASALAAIAAGFATGKVAYFALGGATDFSAYQGITFGFRSNATAPDGRFEIRLCSDAVGNVAVDTFAVTGYAVANVWERMYINKGSALGASIQSIALYATTDPGTVDVHLDNINATKAPGADCLNLTTLIGKLNGAEGGWYPIRYIEGTSVVLDVSNMVEAGTPANNAPGFYGTTETVTGYIRKPIRVEAGLGTMQEAGTSGSLINYSGGWNRTDMSTQVGDTYVDNGNCASTFLVPANFTSLTHLHPMRFNIGLSAINLSGFELGEYRPISCPTAISFIGAVNLLIGTIASNGCDCTASFAIFRNIRIGTLSIYNAAKGSATTNAPIQLGDSSSYGNNLRIESWTIRGCNTRGWTSPLSIPLRNFEFWSVDIQYSKADIAFYVDSGMIDYRFGTVLLQNNNINFYVGGGCGVIQSLTLAAPTTASLQIGTGALSPHFGDHRVMNASISGTISPTATLTPADGWLHLGNYNGVVGDHRSYYDGGLGAFMQSELGANRHTASGIGWRIDCLRSEYSSDFPVRLKLADLALESGVASTIRLFVRRTNTAISARLKVHGDEVNGVSETTDTITVAAGAWEELAITVTPSEEDTLGVWLEVWGGSTHSIYFDDMTVV